MKNKMMKTMVAFSILLFITFQSVGCSTSNENPPQKSKETPITTETPTSTETPKETITTTYKDGTYEGVGKGFGGDVKVEVEVVDNKIVKITITEHSETEGVGSKAVAQLPDAIVKAQSTEIDAVAGASYSSAAIKEGTKNALEKAK
ncbi:FMN-binding domain [Desulfitobacterium hafniense]|uniref:FMN-binding domain n=1 Tax=Desulfitobacterium hafniense TaxID=49338 RepID=A0A098B6I8_DESHA|nr:FMN-binding protein [Desulfitobacterium hafniense]CDX03972.1 FMN-binding domain [Desulfitobacterium hafniense]